MKILTLLVVAATSFGISYIFSKRFLEWFRYQSLGTRDYIVEKLSLMYIEVPPHKILLGLFSFSFGLGFISFLLLLPQLFPGFALGAIVTIVGWKAPKPIVDWMYQRRVNLFTLQMVDALSLMSNGLKSGLSVIQSMGLVSQEMPDPIKQEFDYILNQNKLGVSIEEAFIGLSKRIKSDDVEMFVTSVNILKETGGNLAETFDTIVTTIRDRIKVQNKIDAMTAQGMMQGYFVSMIPPGLGLVFYQTDPDFMRPLFTTTVGWIFIIIILALDIVGFLVMRRLVRVEI